MAGVLYGIYHYFTWVMSFDFMKPFIEGDSILFAENSFVFMPKSFSVIKYKNIKKMTQSNDRKTP